MLKGVPHTHSPGGYYFMRIFLIHVVFFFSNYLCPGNLSCFEAFSVQHVLPSDHCHPPQLGPQNGGCCVFNANRPVQNCCETGLGSEWCQGNITSIRPVSDFLPLQ